MENFTENSKNMTDKEELKPMESYYITFVVSMLIILLNVAILVVLILYRQEKNLKKLKLTFQLSTLCLTDVFAGLCLFLYRFPFCEPFSVRRDVCTALVIFLQVSQIVSQINLIGLTFRRYIILRNINSTSVTWKRQYTFGILFASSAVVIAYIGPAVFFLPEARPTSRGQCTAYFVYENNTTKIGRIVMSIIALLLLLTNVMCGLCIKLLIRIRPRNHMNKKLFALTIETKNKNDDCKTKLDQNLQLSISTINTESEVKHVTTTSLISENHSKESIHSKGENKPKLRDFEVKRDKMVQKALKTYTYAMFCSNICIWSSLVLFILNMAFKVSTQVATDMAITVLFLNALFNPCIYVINIEAFRQIIFCHKSTR
jgi:hypothetical protein